MQHITTLARPPDKQRGDYPGLPDVQGRWFMVEECAPEHGFVAVESYPLDELLRRFPYLTPLYTPDQPPCKDLWVGEGLDGTVCVRIFPDDEEADGRDF